MEIAKPCFVCRIYSIYGGETCSFAIYGGPACPEYVEGSLSKDLHHDLCPIINAE
jgi:hypothetical protein